MQIRINITIPRIICNRNRVAAQKGLLRKAQKLPKSVRAKGIPKDEPESTDAKVRTVKKDPEQKVQLQIKQ